MDQIRHWRSTFVGKVEREAKIDPPIQAEYLRSGGAMILIFMVDGARAINCSFFQQHGGTSR